MQHEVMSFNHDTSDLVVDVLEGLGYSYNQIHEMQMALNRAGIYHRERFTGDPRKAALAVEQLIKETQ